MAEAVWQYVAENANGDVVKGAITADTQSHAQVLLEQDKLIPLRLTRSRSSNTVSNLSFRRHELTIGDHALIARGLADLLNAGIPVAEAFSLLGKRQKRQKLRRFLDDQTRRLRAGASLSESLEQDRSGVPRLTTAMVAAGEASGNLGAQLEIVAGTLERMVKLRRELSAQLIYPAALFILIILTLIFLSYFVLPQFEVIFTNADALPPPETQFVIGLGAFIRTYGAFVPAAILLVMLIFGFARRQYQYQLSHLVARLPVLGGWSQKREAGAYCRSLGALLTSGTPLTEALPIALKAVSSPYLADAYYQAAQRIRAGARFSTSLEAENTMPAEVISLAEIGEASGKLGPMLTKAAQLCEDDIRSTMTRVTSLSGPVLTAVMGLVTAGVIASVMSGVLSLNDAIY